MSDNVRPAAPPDAYGVQQQTRVDGLVDAQVEELRTVGYTTVPSGFSPAELQTLRQRMEAIYQTQVEEAGGLAALARCKDLDVARCPLAYDELFLGVATHPALLAIVRRMLGQHSVLLQQNGLFNRSRSEHHQTNWHRDLAYQHWTSSEPIAINALLTVDEFTLENGATHVLPASHLRAEFPSPGHVERFARQLAAPAGTFLVLDAMLFHRAGHNRSAADRRGINHVIGRPFLAQQIDLTQLVDARHAQDPFLSGYLGFRWNPSRSVAAWRAAHS